MTTRDRERWREIVAELERWYVGPDVVDPGRSLKHVGEWRDILNEACKRIAELEAERDLLRRIAVHTVNETDGFASEHATIGFLCGLPAEVAAIKRERDALRAEVVRWKAENTRLFRDRYDALSVTSREGLLSSEWVARTGKAERERDEAEAEVERLREVVRRTHANYCVSDYTDRGRHASECLLFEIEDTKP